MMPRKAALERGYRYSQQQDGSCVVKYQAGPGKRYYIGKYKSREAAEAEVQRLEHGEQL